MTPYFKTLVLIAGARALTVYDCSSPETKIREVSLKEVKDCDDVPQNYNQGSPVRAQVLKKVNIHHFTAKSCYMKISLTHAYCGTDGIYTYSYSGMESIAFDEVLNIPSEDCLNAHVTGSLTIDFGDSIKYNINLGKNKFIAGSDILRGRQDTETRCTGAEFSLRNKEYKSNVLALHYSLSLTLVTGEFNSLHNDFTLDGKIRCPANRKYYYDPQYGTYAWDSTLLPKTKCEAFYEVLTAAGQIFEPQNPKSNYQNIVMIQDERNARQAAFLQNDAQVICDSIGFSTQIDNIYIVLLDKNNKPAPVRSIQSEATSITENLESQIGQSHISKELKIEEAFKKTLHSICEANRLRLKESLRNFATGSASLEGADSEGTIVIRGGSVAYIFSCQAKDAKLRLDDTDSCYNEIPITIEGDRKFADPVSLVILPNATKTVCSQLTPIKYALRDSNESYSWYCSSPTLTKCQEPSMLDPMITKSNPYNPSISDLNMNFYSDKQLKELERFLHQKNVRDTIISNFVHQMNSEPNLSPGGAVIKTLSIIDGQQLKKRLVPQAFRSLSEIWEKAKSWIIAFFIIKVVFNLVLMILRIRKIIVLEKGISWKTLAAINSQIFTSLISQLNNQCPCYNVDDENNCPCYNEELIKEKVRELTECEIQSQMYWPPNNMKYNYDFTKVPI